MTATIRYAILALVAFAEFAFGEPFTHEQREAKALIQNMYSHSAKKFDLGEFDGKIDAAKQCTLVEEYFLKTLITHPKMSKRCLVGDVYIRYPGLADEDFQYHSDPATDAKPKIGEPVVEGDKASVAVTSKFGRTVYFLTKTDEGLRIENALYYVYWPTDDESCASNFLVKPNAWQKKAEQPICRQ